MEISSIKRKINLELKKENIFKCKPIGFVGRIHGQFKVENGDYYMAKQTNLNLKHLIFLPSSIYKIEKVLDFNDYKKMDFEEIKNKEIIHHYQNDSNKVAIASLIEIDKNSNNQKIEQIYNILVQKGFSQYIEIVDNGIGNVIKIKEEV